MPCPPCLQLSGCQPNYKSQYLLNTPLTSTCILCLVPFSMKLSSTSFFLILLLISSFLQVAMAGSVIGGTIRDKHRATAFCSGKCQVRCSKASIKDGCLKYCNICCQECNCVPPGTYGNKDQCPCYRDKVVKGTKKPKCP